MSPVSSLRLVSEHQIAASNPEYVNDIVEPNVDYIITTEKDWVKIDPLKPNFPFIIVKIEIELIEKNSINKLLKDYLAKN